MILHIPDTRCHLPGYPEKQNFFRQQDRRLEDLRRLEEQGVKILTCGTCLNFYGLTEQLRVGTVSNMYDIVTRMQKAGKVVSL